MRLCPNSMPILQGSFTRTSVCLKDTFKLKQYLPKHYNRPNSSHTWAGNIIELQKGRNCINRTLSERSLNKMLLFRRHGCHRSFWNKQGRLVTLAYGFCLKTDIGRNSLCSNRSIQTRYARTRSYLNIQTRHSVVPCRTVQLTGYASQPCRTQSQINLENLEKFIGTRENNFFELLKGHGQGPSPSSKN